MRQFPSDKYNVAWFKLAECVARGEKERALGVYRLLSHSFSDPALAHQLKGDILWLFEDDNAINTYREAALLYTQNERFLQAAGVYEHLHTLHPKDHTFLEDLIDLYTTLHMSKKVERYSRQLFDVQMNVGELEQAVHALTRLDTVCKVYSTVNEHKKLLFALLKKGEVSQKKLMSHAKNVIEGLFHTNNNAELKQFLSQVQAVDNECYIAACAYMESDKFTQ